MSQSVDESYDQHNRKQSRVVNALPTESHDVVRRNGRRTQGGGGQRVVADPVPLAKPVPLAAHYNRLYNHHMNRRLGNDSESESSDEEDMVPEREVEEACSEDYVTALRQAASARSPPRAAQSEDYAATLKRAAGRPPPPVAAQPPSQRKRPRQQYDTENRSECFLCSWGNRFHDGIKAEHVATLNGMINNHGHMGNLELAQQMHLYFLQYVYQRERGMAILTVAVALEHIEGLHTHAALVFLGEQLNTYKRLHFCLENEIYREDGSRDDRALNMLFKVDERLDRLYSVDVAKMNFNMGKTREDTRALGRATRIMTMTKQVEEREKRQQRIVWQSEVVEEFSV